MARKNETEFVRATSRTTSESTTQTNSSSYEKKKVCDIVTERFMDQLSKGQIPWEKPWISVKGSRVGGWSHNDGRSYSLINQMMLPHPGEYITYRQIRDEGGKLKKGAKGYPIVFWKSYQATVKGDNNVDEEKTIPVLRYYTVFDLEDVEGIEPKYQEDLSELEGLKEPQKCKAAEAIVKSYVERTGLTLRNDKASNEAYYMPLNDTVVMPLKKQFKKKAEYYSTLFHELIHSTGHRSRLNRLGTGTAARGKAYSLEELVAEIGASAVLYNLGIETKDSVKNSAAYIQSWLKALGDDHNMIIKASARAQKAVRFLFGDESVTPHGDVKPLAPSVEPAPAL